MHADLKKHVSWCDSFSPLQLWYSSFSLKHLSIKVALEKNVVNGKHFKPFQAHYVPSIIALYYSIK